jgi:hypothetical protein
MILDALLAFAVVMSSATQLTLPHIGLTIGEFGIGLWIVLMTSRLIILPEFMMSHALVRIGTFWTGMAVALSLGAIVGYFNEVLSASYVLHDSAAYVLLALFTILSLSHSNVGRRYQQAARFLIVFANLALAIQLSFGFGMFNATEVHPWYWDRFQGWSTNPNQLALYCAIYCPIALHLAVTSRRWSTAVLAASGLFLPILTGLLTKSDTFLIVSIIAALTFLGLEIRRWLDARDSMGRQLFLVSSVGVAALAVSLAPLSTGGVGDVLSTGRGLVREKGSLSAGEAAGRRLDLLSEAVDRGLASMSLGLGPGPHLQVRPATEPYYGANRFEAHNTFLDFFTQGGVAAVLLLVWIYGAAGLYAWRARQSALVALMTAVAIFSIPHLVIRHPIVWFAICLSFASGGAPRPVTSRAVISTKNFHEW